MGCNREIPLLPTGCTALGGTSLSHPAHVHSCQASVTQPPTTHHSCTCIPSWQHLPHMSTFRCAAIAVVAPRKAVLRTGVCCCTATAAHRLPAGSPACCGASCPRAPAAAQRRRRLGSVRSRWASARQLPGIAASTAAYAAARHFSNSCSAAAGLLALQQAWQHAAAEQLPGRRPPGLKKQQPPPPAEGGMAQLSSAQLSGKRAGKAGSRGS